MASIRPACWGPAGGKVRGATNIIIIAAFGAGLERVCFLISCSGLPRHYSIADSFDFSYYLTVYNAIVTEINHTSVCWQLKLESYSHDYMRGRLTLPLHFSIYGEVMIISLFLLQHNMSVLQAYCPSH
jgi:hypothetical protein